ncbi:hypothetical protein [Helicobacter pylori]|uniref:hypothetical protein n=1 Tax=Helicobacter pylori TaxID=210 RepID=UPI001968A724|nr:hypothetical protein [Helicobacter pylori]
MAGYKKAGLILAVIFGFAVFFVECSGSEKPPIDLRMTFGYNPYWISIISNVDSITILSTKINRGDCGGISRIDRKLGFGNSYGFRILPSFCRYVKEISVKTDKGTWNFTFARK